MAGWNWAQFVLQWVVDVSAFNEDKQVANIEMVWVKIHEGKKLLSISPPKIIEFRISLISAAVLYFSVEC